LTKGTVKYFNDLRGWGIIGNASLDQDVYVHYTAINMDGFKTLKEGQDVLFELKDTDEGLHANNVSLAS
jgi:CspA family cold shock protein